MSPPKQTKQEEETPMPCNCHVTGLCPETGFKLTECDWCGDGILEEEEIDDDTEKQCADCKIEAKKHCDECGGYGSCDDEEEEEIDDDTEDEED